MDLTQAAWFNTIICKVQAVFVIPNRKNRDFTLRSVLGLDQDEAQLYLLIVYSGKMTVSKIADAFNWNAEKARLCSTTLMKKGMFIEIKEDEFESLHPRFALTNRFRRRCSELGVGCGRNDHVDSLAIYLEKYYDLARTK